MKSRHFTVTGISSLRFLLFSFGWILGGFVSGQAVAAVHSPNVIIIFVDDQGYYDLGCYGATEVKTPRIDRMAGEGILFADYYAAAPICSPSRAGLLTGCYPRRVGNHIWVHRADSLTGIHPDELTLAELFKLNGYATACVGKWHLGFAEPFLPKNQGFDEYFGLLHNLDPVEAVYFGDDGVPLMRNDSIVKQPVDPSELTQSYTDEAIKLIKRHESQPFFLYLSHTMLHKPLGVSEPFRGASGWGEYGDAIQELDYSVGRIFDALEELQIDDKTVVVYASDNGRGPGRTPGQNIQGSKLSTFEGGIRVPAIVWGPGVGIQAGRQSTEVIRAMDWYPTLATLADISVPEGFVIDGRDITSLLKGDTSVVPAAGLKRTLNATVPLRRRWEPPEEWAAIIKRHEFNDAFFYHGSQGELAAVRWKRWKLQLNPAPLLYDLVKDPGERKPIRNPQIIRKLRGMAILFQQEMLADCRLPGRTERIDFNGKTTVPQSIRESLNILRDVSYASYGERTLEMDICRPKDAWGQLPAIICIHGGGWANGSRESHAGIAQMLASRGYVAATISYRLSGEARFPAQIHDCKAAVRFLRVHADEYGIDPGNIGAIGLSAGGHLAALLATSAGVSELEGNGGNAEASSAIQAAVPMGAQTDFLSKRNQEISASEQKGSIWRQFLGGSQKDRPRVYETASPLTYLDQTDPPCWFLSGENDDPSTHAIAFRNRMSELGVSSGLTLIEGAPHGFISKQIWFNQMVEEADQFFDRTLRIEK